ncbi:hypothetical protein [Saccharopolyspora elongata]|uniref:Uncharacterized protein n=1 Tax=Saccharopolyspora elongata TaxID=2530387 RepID=A0A4R4YSH3_9PSEU|nr:hypothetical protein [Saccharopolyspora elongata]TDD48173.1 hypothetical protein E1288_23075 [Saccharopolyspora elongata]
MRLPLWAAFIALFGLGMWFNFRLITLTLTDGPPADSAAEAWYAQGLFVSLVGSGLFFCLALLCGAPASTRPARGHASSTPGGPQASDHPAQASLELGDDLWR